MALFLNYTKICMLLTAAFRGVATLNWAIPTLLVTMKSLHKLHNKQTLRIDIERPYFVYNFHAIQPPLILKHRHLLVKTITAIILKTMTLLGLSTSWEFLVNSGSNKRVTLGNLTWYSFIRNYWKREMKIKIWFIATWFREKYTCTSDLLYWNMIVGLHWNISVLI